MPDYMFLLESRLSPEQRAALLRVQEIAQAQEVNVYLAGGAVRDLISGMPIRDLDFVVEGNPFRMAHELEKGGARLVPPGRDERLRHVELIFHGDVDGSLAAAREEIYERPGTKPVLRWATVMEDLRRRDFSLNAIAISLNPASRGLLLDPTNGLADLEKREVRALSMHSFTNQPMRLLRAVRFCLRMHFKLESRTEEWFALAMERGLHDQMDSAEVGDELRQLAREDHPIAILKAWEARGLAGAIHPRLPKRHADYTGLARLRKMRDVVREAGYRPRLFAPVLYYVFRRLKSRERGAAFSRLKFRAAELDAISRLEAEAVKVARMLRSRKTAAPLDAWNFLEKVPLDLVVFVQTEHTQARVLSQLRNYLFRWKPMRRDLVAVGTELESLGLPRGPKFDKVLEEFFNLQLRGKGRTPQDRTRLLYKLAGIKPPPKHVPRRAEGKKKHVPIPAKRDEGRRPERGPAPSRGFGSAGRGEGKAAARPLRAEPKGGRPLPAPLPVRQAGVQPSTPEASRERTEVGAALRGRPLPAKAKPKPRRTTTRKKQRSRPTGASSRTRDHRVRRGGKTRSKGPTRKS